jgi:hypothetical protein
LKLRFLKKDLLWRLKLLVYSTLNSWVAHCFTRVLICFSWKTKKSENIDKSSSSKQSPCLFENFSMFQIKHCVFESNRVGILHKDKKPSKNHQKPNVPN